MRTNLVFYLIVYFLLIIRQNHYAEADIMNQTVHLCQPDPPTPEAEQLSISCEAGSKVYWIGLRNFGFGLLANGSDCNTEDNSSFVISSSQNSQCAQTLTAMLQILDSFSGRVYQSRSISLHDDCNLKTAYFIANYDCVGPHVEENDVKFDKSCEYNKTVERLPISSSSYPGENINSTGVRSCVCSLTITAGSLVLRTYDNRLAENQKLSLSYGNHTVIQLWKNATTIEEVMNTFSVREQFSDTQLLLSWENGARGDRGKLWVVLEAVGGNITAICQQNISTTVSTTATTLSPIATTLSPSTTLSNGSSSTTPPAGNLNISSPITPNTSKTNVSLPPEKSTPLNPNAAEVTVSTGLTPSNRTSGADMDGMQSTASSVATTNGLPDSEDEKVNIALIIGCAIGGLLLLIILIICCLIWCMKKNRRTEPERNEEPANGRFRNDSYRNRQRDNAKLGEDSKDRDTDFVRSAEAAIAASGSRNIFPPLPTEKFVKNVQDQGGLNDLVTSKNEINKIEASNFGENGKSNNGLHAQLIGDVPVQKENMTSDDLSPVTEPVPSLGNYIHGGSEITAEENAVADENGQEKRKKKKKKKRKKKRNTIEALLGENATGEPETSQDYEHFQQF